MAQWYWMHDGQKHGPVDTAQLKELAQAGELQPADMIWRNGLPNWIRASRAKGLFAHEPRYPHSGVAHDTAPADTHAVEHPVASPFQNVDDSFGAYSDETTKPCPYCAEGIAKAAVKCKHCGEFLSQGVQSAGRPEPMRQSNSVQQLGEGQFAFTGVYDWSFDIAQQAMFDCKVNIKEADRERGLIKGKCSYGINLLGITVTGMFHASGDQTILELSATLTDAFDTFGACKKKVQQISERLLELANARPSSNAVVSSAPVSTGHHASARPPSYLNRAGPSHRGKAITGLCLSLGGLLMGPLAIVGVIMSGVALTNMTRSNNEEGKGLAIAGIIVGFVALLSWALWLPFAFIR